MFSFFANNSFESFVFTCLTYKNVQRFRNGQVHEFYGLKASQISKVHASSHEYPHVEKVKNLHEQNFKIEVNKKRLNFCVKYAVFFGRLACSRLPCSRSVDDRKAARDEQRAGSGRGRGGVGPCSSLRCFPFVPTDGEPGTGYR